MWNIKNITLTGIIKFKFYLKAIISIMTDLNKKTKNIYIFNL